VKAMKKVKNKIDGQLPDDLSRLHQPIAKLQAQEVEHKHTRKLKDSEVRYRRLFETAQDSILILDGVTGTIIDANPVIIDLLGYSLRELHGKSLWEIGAFKDIVKSKASYKKLQDNNYVRYENLPLETKDGRWVSVEFVSNAYEVDHKRVIQCNIRDITRRKQKDAAARKKTKRTLQQGEERYRSLFEQSIDPIYITGQNGEFVNVNESAFDAADRRKFQKKIEQNGFVRNYPIKFRKKDGIVIDCLLTSTLRLDDDKNILGYQGIIRDITEQKKVDEELTQSYRKLKKTFKDTVLAIAAICETRDPYTAGHQIRVTELACAVAGEMGLTEEEISIMEIGATLHDIGKMYVPSEILSKPGKLTESEFSLIKMHPRVGYDIVKKIDFPGSIAAMVLQHHERLDGSGYPQGLKGNNIILEAKILAVADVVEAMSSHRPYRPALGLNLALDEITEQKGILYDDKVVEACFKVFRDKEFKFE